MVSGHHRCRKCVKNNFENSKQIDFHTSVLQSDDSAKFCSDFSSRRIIFNVKKYFGLRNSFETTFI